MTIAAVAALVLVASASAEATRPPVALVASPARVALRGAASATVQVTNTGTRAVVVGAAPGTFALDLRGRPRVLARRAPWLTVRPKRLALGPGATAALKVSSRPPRRAEPGDHPGLVLLTTRPVARAGLAVRMRLGVVVVVRVPGRIVHRLGAVRLRVRRAGRTRLLDVLLANRGNVTETIGPRCTALTLRRGRRILARLHPVRRNLLPHATGLVEFRYRGAARGRVTAHVVARPGPRCGKAQPRTFVVRL